MPGNDFKVFMFANDFVRIRTWVLRYPDSETGGDLFGLWTNPGRDAVLHVILGPGRECTHGQYHFYQDINYLSSLGELLTNNFMLCHIGEWHSHHKLKLCKPSEGDCNTVIRNFPKGACGFLLLIANITSETSISVSPYLFKEGSYTYKAGNVQILETIESPFRLIPKVGKALEDGEEEYVEYGSPARGNGTQSQRGGTRHETTHSGEEANYGTQEKRPQKSYADASRGTKDGQAVYKPADKYGEEIPARGSETHSQRSSGSKHPHSDEQANHGTQEEQPQKTYDIIVQQPSQGDSKPTVEYSEGGDTRTQRGHRQEGQTSTAVVQSSPSTSNTVDVASCTKEYQWYTKEEGQMFLKEVQEGLKAISDSNTEVEIVRDKNFWQDVSIQLQHHGNSLVITFPHNYLSKEYISAKLSNVSYHGKSRFTNFIAYIKSQNPKEVVTEIWSASKKDCPHCKPQVTHVSSVLEIRL